jgi:hypothetical protein
MNVAQRYAMKYINESDTNSEFNYVAPNQKLTAEQKVFIVLVSKS